MRAKYLLCIFLMAAARATGLEIESASTLPAHANTLALSPADTPRAKSPLPIDRPPQTAITAFAKVARSTYCVGMPVLIPLKVQEHGKPKLDALDTQAVITAPGGVKATVTLNDAGRDGDAAAGDCIYTGTFVPAVPGEHSLYASTRFTDASGKDWKTGSRESFHAVNAGAMLVTTPPAVTFIEVDTQDDGLYDRVELHGALDVTEVGDYRLKLVLRDQQGRELHAFSHLIGGHETRVPVGRQKFGIDIIPLAITEAGIEFPMHLVKAELWRSTETGDATVQVWQPPAPPDVAAVVIAPRATEFMQGETVLIEGVPEWIEHRGADGLITDLEAALRVRVRVEDRFTFSVSLRDACDRHVGGAQRREIHMVPGTIYPLPLHFDGAALGSTGGFGVFKIVELRFDGYRTHAFPGSFPGPREFKPGEFVGYVPFWDRNRNGKPDTHEVFCGGVDANYNGVPDDVETDPSRLYDFADDLENVPPRPDTPNFGVNAADAAAFTRSWLASSPHALLADLADDGGNVPPRLGEPNSGVNEADWNVFWEGYFRCAGAPFVPNPPPQETPKRRGRENFR